MKTLILVRHAKSSWANPDTDDFDRPLNKRGEHDAPFMGKLVFDKVGKPDLIYSSPANRALTTAQFFATEMSYNPDAISQQKLIYQQGGRAIIKLLMGTPKEHNIVILFGHNPDITSLANYFSDVNIDHMPTCAVACIDFDTDDWSWISDSNGKLRFFEYPKKYMD